MGRRESPVRKSPSRREKSPAWGRSSNEKDLSSRSRSSRRSRSRSPAYNSPKKDRRGSPSPTAHSLLRNKSFGRTRSPPPVSPIKEKLPSRPSSPKGVKTISSDSRAAERKMSIRASSPRNARSRSPESRSPSPRTKRLNRAKSERDAEKGGDRQREKVRSRNGEPVAYKEKYSGKDIQTSPLRNARSMSPKSRSPSPRTKRLNRAKSARDVEKGGTREREKDHRRNGEPAAYKENDSETEIRTSTLRNAGSKSPESRSPSPRTKRLNRAKAERDTEKVSAREHEKDRSRNGGPAAHKKKDSDKDIRTSSLRNARSKSPVSRSPSPRTNRLNRAKAERDAEKGSYQERENDRRNGDLAAYKEKDSDKDIRTSSLKNVRSRSRESRSPSPRTKRLRRAKAERDAEKGSFHESEKILKDTDNPVEKRDRRSGKEDVDRDSSRARHRRSNSPSNHRHRGQNRSRSPSAAGSRGRDEIRSSRDDEHVNDDDDPIARMNTATDQLEAKEKEKQKPSFELSGKLADETNRVKGVTLLFNEPPDARIPDIRWRLYVFKGGEVLNEPLYVHRQSCYLFGRERRVAEIPTDHPSCSKQHAVLQFRRVDQENPDGTMSKKVRPYLMDLGSTNGTFINDEKIEAQRYYELFEKDTLKFGNSSREYVLLHENSTG